MAKKDELTKRATELNIPLTGEETNPDLENLIQAAELQLGNPGPSGDTGNTPPPPVPPNPGPRNTGGTRAPAPTFNAEQINLINQMFEERLKGIRDSSQNPNNPISLYDLRDPKNIETVKVSRFPNAEGDMLWVKGFKDLQKDIYKKTPKWVRYGIEPNRKLHNEPFVTLLLTADGENVIEREVLLLDYTENREKVDCKVISMRKEEKINDHGILGLQNSFAVAVNEKGAPENRPTLLAQSKTVLRFFTVQPEGFKYPVEFPTDFLA